MTDKHALRAALLARRLAVSEGDACRAASRAAEAVRSYLHGPAGIVAGYWPVRGELDIRPALATLAEAGHRLALPRTCDGSRLLEFRAWEPEQPMRPGRFGIPEAGGEAVTPDLLLVPGLGFDAMRHRLGYGKGYYDATLAALRARAPHLRAVGCGYAFQRVELLPHAPHDMRLDALMLL